MSEQKQSFFQKEIQIGKTFNDKAKEAFYKELTSLLESGIDIQRAFALLVEEQEKKKVKQSLIRISENLINGHALSESMKISGDFTSYEFQSIKIGEETGRLKIIMHHLTSYFSDKVRLRRQLVSVFTYPVFVILITFAVLYFMLNSVVPMFENVFKQFGQELPPLTQKIIWLSENFSSFVFYFGLFIISSAIYFYTQRNELWFKKSISKIQLRIPIFGALIKKIYLARFCQSMSLLLSSKTPLVNTLALVEEMIGFYPLEEALQSMKTKITRGETLHDSMKSFPIFDKRTISLVKIAEEINQLDTTFERLGKQYQEDIDFQSKLIGTIIEPLIIVIIGLIVGVIMVAMYLPMFNLSNVIK